MEQVRPMVCILTDGSGSTGVSRVDSSRRVVRGVNATMGPWQGRVRDRDVYQWLLAGAHDCFLGLADELADIFASRGIRTVAADAAEGFNPAHDVCRLLVNAAVARLSSRGIHIDSFEFVLDRSPADMLTTSSGRVRLALDDAALDRKLTAAENYPELKPEVDRALAAHGRDAFRTECLSRVPNPFDLSCQYEGAPAYERFGTERVAAGIYRTMITFADHVAPLVRALEAAA